MFEQVGEARAGGILVAGPDLVEQVYGGQFGRAVAVHDDRQPVRKRMFLVVDHVVANFSKVRFYLQKACSEMEWPFLLVLKRFDRRC